MNFSTVGNSPLQNNQDSKRYKDFCENYGWLRLSKRLLAALALIIVHSIYLGQPVRASAAPLVVRVCNLSGGVVYVRQYPHPALFLDS